MSMLMATVVMMGLAAGPAECDAESCAAPQVSACGMAVASHARVGRGRRVGRRIGRRARRLGRREGRRARRGRCCG